MGDRDQSASEYFRMIDQKARENSLKRERKLVEKKQIDKVEESHRAAAKRSIEQEGKNSDPILSRQLPESRLFRQGGSMSNYGGKKRLK